MKPLRIGMIGVTGRGNIARYWHDPGGRSVVVGGMDVSDRALTGFKDQYGPDVLVTRDVDELLARSDIEAIAVTSPDWTHEDYVIKALAAGKHVYCEKPMAITVEGCDRMLEAWQRAGTHFMIGFNMRYMNLFRTMKDIVDSGIIGEVKAAWCRHFVGRGGDWYYHDWHAARRYSNSLLLQKAAHDIDVIHWITGRYTERVTGLGGLDYYGGDRPDTLTCPSCADKHACVEYQPPERESHHENQRVQCVFRKEVDVEDQSIIMMSLEGGIKATYMQCHFAPDYWRNHTFIGTEGRVENLDDHSKVVVKLRNRSTRWKNLADQVYDVKPAVGGHGGGDPAICRDFVDMVLDGKRPVATPLAGRMSVAAACAGTDSIRQGSAIKDVPPVSAALQDFVY
jgi:predicted dehydrogenase